MTVSDQSMDRMPFEKRVRHRWGRMQVDAFRDDGGIPNVDIDVADAGMISIDASGGKALRGDRGASNIGMRTVPAPPSTRALRRPAALLPAVVMVLSRTVMNGVAPGILPCSRRYGRRTRHAPRCPAY